MMYLERIRVVQFFLFEQQDVEVGEITGIFGPNGSGKSSLLDAVQIAMLGANSRQVALNAQADEQATTRSLRAYCLGQYGEGPEHRVRDNATTYITLIWRNSETGAPLSMGVCLYASADRDGHDVRGRYILPDIELSMGDHLEQLDGEQRPQAWETFRHQLIERARVSGEDPLYTDSQRYIRSALLALRGSSGNAPAPDAFRRAFRFALRMRFDKTVDQIVRDDVVEARPTNIKKFKEVTESFRRLADMVAQVEAKIADGERVNGEYEKASDESRRVATWHALSRTAAAQVAVADLEQALIATQDAEQALQDCEARESELEREAEAARTAAERARMQREAHAAHKDYGALQTAIQAAQLRAQNKRAEIVNNIQLLRRSLTEAADSPLLHGQAPELKAAAQSLDQLRRQVSEDATTQEAAIAALRPALKTAQQTFTELFRQNGGLQSALNEAREAERQARENLKRVHAGKLPLSKPAQRLLDTLENHGIQATPVCDLVRITAPDWQPVIEAYLGRNMQALLVPAEQEREAFRVYRGLKGEHAVYGAKIAMESRQDTGKRPADGSVAALIAGDDPAAVAYLRRQFGDLRCADSDSEALAGQRTLTSDGMLVSGGEIERLRPVPPTELRIGASSASYLSAAQAELDLALKTLRELEDRQRDLSTLVSVLQKVAHEETAIKHVTDTWAAMTEARQEAVGKTELLQGMADQDYVRLGEEEQAALQRVSVANGLLRKVAEEIGAAKGRQTLCKTREGAAKAAVEASHAAATQARAHPSVDKDFEARQWDTLLEKHGDAYADMQQYADQQAANCRKRMDAAVNGGARELGVFLQKYREQAPLEITGDWQAAWNWLKSLLRQLHDTQLAPFKEDMDAAYRTSQETFRNDVAIALNNNLDELKDTIDRLNIVLRECPAYSNGERYQFRGTPRKKLEPLLNFVKKVATHGPADDLFGGAGELPEEFRALLEDKIAPGVAGARSPLDDYREFFDFDIEILREDPVSKASKSVGHLSKRLGPGSGGEHRAPLYIIAGAALASAYRLDRGSKDGVRLMLLDEAFNKMDPTNIIATMRYLEELGLQVFMASPGENLGILTAFLHRYYDILRDVDNNAVMIEGREVSAEARALFRSDLPEFNPGLVEQELALLQGRAAAGTVKES